MSRGVEINAEHLAWVVFSGREITECRSQAAAGPATSAAELTARVLRRPIHHRAIRAFKPYRWCAEFEAGLRELESMHPDILFHSAPATGGPVPCHLRQRCDERRRAGHGEGRLTSY